MTRKRTMMLLAILCLAALLLAAGPRVSGSADGTSGLCRIQGTWIRSLAGETRLIIQETLSPQDPSGNRLTYVQRWVNPDETLFGLFPEADFLSESVGEAVRTSPNTYDYSAISYGTKAPTVSGERDQVEYIVVTSGSIECIDDDTNIDIAILSIFMGEQDADGDGLPDEGQEPVLCLGPFLPETAKRVHVMPTCSP